MNIIDASEKWEVNIRTVKNYIKKGIIPFDEIDGIIVIPDEIPRPFVINKNLKNLNANKIRAYIIKATFQEKYIDENSFHGKMRQGSFKGYMDELETKNIVYRTSDWRSNENNLGYNISQDFKKVTIRFPKDIKIIINLFNHYN